MNNAAKKIEAPALSNEEQKLLQRMKARAVKAMRNLPVLFIPA